MTKPEQKGFTTIELMIALIIVCALVGVAFVGSFLFLFLKAIP